MPKATSAGLNNANKNLCPKSEPIKVFVLYSTSPYLRLPELKAKELIAMRNILHKIGEKIS